VYSPGMRIVTAKKFFAVSKANVVVLRGLPGSGKSTAVQALTVAVNEGGCREVKTFSSDKFFTDPATGEYKFDPLKLNMAHGRCLRDYDSTLFNGQSSSLLIVDNTNLSAVEAAPYLALANAFGRCPAVLTLRVNPYEAFKRCVHGVPGDKFAGMVEVFREAMLPPWWKHYSVDERDDSLWDERTFKEVLGSAPEPKEG